MRCLIVLIAAALNAATIENYYKVVALDRETVLCDSRESACAEYSDGIGEFPSESAAGAFLYVDIRGFQASASMPGAMINTRQDVYVHQVFSFSDSSELWYRYRGQPAGTTFSAVWQAGNCIEGESVYGNPQNPIATATYTVNTTLPSGPRTCMGPDEVVTEIVFDQPYRSFVDYVARYEVFLGPGTNDSCISCGQSTFIGSSFFTGYGYTQGGDFLTDVEIIPAEHAPEPSTWLMLLSGLALIARRSIRRVRN